MDAKTQLGPLCSLTLISKGDCIIKRNSGLSTDNTLIVGNIIEIKSESEDNKLVIDGNEDFDSPNPLVKPQSSSFKMENVIVQNCKASKSTFLILVSNCSKEITLTNCEFKKNIHEEDFPNGGVILVDYKESDITIDNCSFSGNKCKSSLTSSPCGGAIYFGNFDKCTIKDSTFESNVIISKDSVEEIFQDIFYYCSQSAKQNLILDGTNKIRKFYFGTVDTNPNINSYKPLYLETSFESESRMTLEYKKFINGTEVAEFYEDSNKSEDISSYKDVFSLSTSDFKIEAETETETGTGTIVKQVLKINNN